MRTVTTDPPETPNEETTIAVARVQASETFDLEARIVCEGDGGHRHEIVVIDTDGDGADGETSECAFFDADDFFEAVERLRAFLVPREPTNAERTMATLQKGLQEMAPMFGALIDASKASPASGAH